MNPGDEIRGTFLQRYLLRLALLAVLAFGYALLVTHVGKPQYRGEILLAFKSTQLPYKYNLLALLENPMPLFLEDDIYSVTYDIPTVLDSKAVTGKVIEKGKFKERLYDPEEFPDYREWKEIFQSHMNYYLDSETQSITIWFRAETPELAKEITGLYANEFEERFIHLYYRASIADAIQEIVDRRTDELARINERIDNYLVAHGKVALLQQASRTVIEYLFTQRAKLLSEAEMRGYELAVERVKDKYKDALSGKEYSPIREALYDYITVFLKALAYEEYQRLAELEMEYGPKYPEAEFWSEAVAEIENLIVTYSKDALGTAVNTLEMRRIAAKAKYEVIAQRAEQLKADVDWLPEFESDLTGLMRMKGFLEVALWFWGKRLEFHRMGEDLVDDPFVVMDPVVKPEKPYRPVLTNFFNLFIVLFTVGTLFFLLRYKLENEYIMRGDDG